MSFSDAERSIIANSKRYNGWTNYETWCVKLWMDNERGDYEHWNEVAREIWGNSRDHGHQHWTRSEFARFTLADKLKEDYEDAMPEIEGVWSDMLRAAFSEVNWEEIADNLLDECEDEADPDDEDSDEEPERYESA